MIDNDFPTERPRKRNLVALVAAGSVAVAAAAGCSPGGARLTYDKFPATVSEGSVKAGVNVRTDAGVVEDPGVSLSNACGITEEVFRFTEQSVLEAKRTDANGPWIGFNVKDNPNLPHSCEDDGDGIVWISAQYVKADISVSDSVGPVQETQN